MIPHFEITLALDPNGTEGPSTATFKEHLERIKFLLLGTQPMLLRKVYDSQDDREDLNQDLEEFVPQMMKEDQRLQKRFAAPKVSKS